MIAVLIENLTIILKVMSIQNQVLNKHTRSNSKVTRLIFFLLYWQYCSPPTQTAVYLDPSSILTCSGMPLQ